MRQVKTDKKNGSKKGLFGSREGGRKLKVKNELGREKKTIVARVPSI